MPNEAVGNPSFEEPRKSYIGDLLSMANPSIVVPDWQRSYSWLSEHTEAFWNDLIRFTANEGTPIAGEYFLGAIVLVRKQDGTLLLLDGQQRLATSAILLSVLRDQIKRRSVDAARQIQEQYLTGFDYNEDRRIDKLTLNKYDREFFRRLILDTRGEDYTEPQPSQASHGNIQRARRYYENRIREHLEGSTPEDAYTRTQRLRRALLGHLCVIQVTSSNEDSAADVFEVLNDRGIGLSTPDLLRNLVIRRANNGEEDKVVELWRPVLGFGTDNEIKDFLRHYWVSRYGDVKSQSLYREIKNSVEGQNIGSLALSESPMDSVAIYRQVKSGETEKPQLNSVLVDYVSLPAAAKALLPALLTIAEILEDAEATRAARVLLDVFIRHTLFVGRDNSALENVIYQAARELRAGAGADDFVLLVRGMRQTDDAVEEAFKKISIRNSSFRRYVLRMLEQDRRSTEEIEVAPPSRVHVEHIYPQNPRENERLDNHGKLVDRLGNLTLLSARINKEIQNSNFFTKRPRFLESNLLITSSLEDYDVWNEQKINERQVNFAERVNAIWPA